MQLEDDDRVKGFIGEFTSTYPVLDTEHPATWGALDLQDYYMEHKRAQHMAMKQAKDVIQNVSAEFAETFGILWHVRVLPTGRCRAGDRCH
ncbi:MAG: hypothetical protein R2860_03505 [Desulfobacterales bacterium]